MSTLVRSFPALAGERPQLLILGSMPGRASLTANQYYAHPRNQFWPIMQRLCGLDPGADYPQRCQQLMASGIALWDVYRQCRRAGSLDSAIERGSEQINPLAQLLQEHAGLSFIACNGSAAGQALRRHLLRKLGRPDDTDSSAEGEHWLLTLDGQPARKLQVLVMPSTSPAHAALDLERKWQYWKVLRSVIRECL